MGGWNLIEEMSKLIPGKMELTDEQKQLYTDFADCFGTEAGQRVLEHLRLYTECKPTVPGQVSDGQAMSICMAIREGENNLYRYIKSNLKKGRE